MVVIYKHKELNLKKSKGSFLHVSKIKMKLCEMMVYIFKSFPEMGK